MAKRNQASSTAVMTTTPQGGGSRLSRWGGNDRQVHLSSGRKLQFDEEDQDCILLFLGQKDISEKVIDPKTQLPKQKGEVVYNVFNDGRGPVSVALSYAFTEFRMEAGHYYYMHLVAFVNTKPGFNDMKDFEVKDLGVEGEKVPADKERIGADNIVLNLATIKDLNYNKLNYPLRKV